MQVNLAEILAGIDEWFGKNTYLINMKCITISVIIQLNSSTLHRKKTFTYPLQLKVTEAFDLEIQKAAINAEEAYQRQLILISNSDPDALSATEVERAVTDFLRKRGLVAG
jgi:hypothetical protein